MTACDNCPKEATWVGTIWLRRIRSRRPGKEAYPNLCDSCAAPIIELLEVKK